MQEVQVEVVVLLGCQLYRGRELKRADGGKSIRREEQLGNLVVWAVRRRSESHRWTRRVCSF